MPMLKPFSILTLNEFRELVRNRVSLFWIFLFPFFFLSMMMMSFGHKGGLAGSATIEIVDQDHSDWSARYVDSLRKVFASGDPVAGTLVDADPHLPLQRGRLRVTVPAGFSNAIGNAGEVHVKVEYDKQAGLSTQVAAKVIAPVTIRFNSTASNSPTPVKLDVMDTSGGGPAPIGFPQFLLTGILVMSMMSAAMNNTCVTIADRRERNTFKLMSCLPLSPTAYLLSIVTARVLILVIAAIILILGGRYVYGIQFPIEPVRLLGSVGLMVLGTFMLLTLGVALSSRVTSVTNAIFLCNLVYLSLLFMSDLTMPLGDMPSHVRKLLSFLPTAELVSSIRAVLIQGVPPGQLLQPIGVMMGWTAAFMVISRSAFHWHRI